MTIRGILFDIGDTLLDATGLQRRALEKAVGELASADWMLDAAGFARAYREADDEPQFADTPDLNHLYSDPRVVARAFELLSWRQDPEAAALFLRVYRRGLRAMIRPDETVTRSLVELRGDALRLGVVSNGTTREQKEQLSLLGVAEYFYPIVISEEVGVRKPDPEIFRIAGERLGLWAGEVLVFGDRPDWEIAGARRAGMRGALTTQFVDKRADISPGAEPDFVVRHVSELPAVVRAYNASAPAR